MCIDLCIFFVLIFSWTLKSVMHSLKFKYEISVSLIYLFSQKFKNGTGRDQKYVRRSHFYTV